jgi:hypothetical protein
VIYIDAGLGEQWPSQASLLSVWSSASFADAPPNGLSYPLRIIGDERSAVIEFVDTPALRGNTALLLDGSGKVSRCTVIYDSYQFSSARYHALASLNAET